MLRRVIVIVVMHAARNAVREVDDRQIGAGKPGLITKKVQSIYFDAIKGKIEKYKSWLTYI